MFIFHENEIVGFITDARNELDASSGHYFEQSFFYNGRFIVSYMWQKLQWLLTILKRNQEFE